MKRIKNKSSFPTWEDCPWKLDLQGLLLPTIGHHHLQAKWENRGLPLSPFLLILLSPFLFLFFPCFHPILSCSWTFPPFSSLPVLIVASSNYGSFAKEQGDTGCGAGINHLCHGPHFVGIGGKQRLHPIELLIILPVVLRIFFFHHIT